MSYQNYMNEYNKIGYSKDGITHITNFVGDGDISAMVRFLDSIDDIGTIEQEIISDEYIKFLLSEYEGLVYNKILKHYGDKYDIKFHYTPVRRAHFTKWNMLVGQSMSVHSDSETPSRLPAISGGFYRYNITSLCYLTDDYVGGEIMFPEFDIKIKPKAGDLLLFPSRYRHAINLLESGSRYTMPMFFGFDVEDSFTEQDMFGKLNDEDPSRVLFFE